jgi:putative acetyltransferase
VIRTEAPGDRAAVRRVVEAAFGRPDEAGIVDALRSDAAWIPALSLVAEQEGAVAGHLLISRVWPEDGGELLSLAPLSVLPAHQRQGVGAALMRAGLERAGATPIVVLGHPEYYPRFGFAPAAEHGLTNPWGLHGDEWMVRGEPPFPRGLVRYPAAFG